ncbi:GNAT family N-acetyltransferase [Aurantiacibacter spongiae]|uniref:N-acetyltransferase n=1 Tax=Aurantiacibacter spongiae TaxID=2488860 RepID=A0A3N5DI79_9SPHN|nr:GNAT family N-acetyltransferase [Aurantiacibacter spongiae]RPF71372.1 N-acetyltransferase [Aurantiacibacter spongiae]
MDSDALFTERLVLRPPDRGDLPFLLDCMNTPAVMRHLGGEIRSAAEVEDGLEADIAAFADDTYRHWTIWLRGEDRRIGRCGLFSVRSQAAPRPLRGQREIGWTLAEDFWNMGYASEAARAVLAYAFDTLHLPVIYAQTSDSNHASTRMIARLGFVARTGLGYDDPDYPPRDNPTTVWSLAAGDFHDRG